MRDCDSIDCLSRIAVVGTTGCGKTTFAKHVADALAMPRIELDALYWGPNWTPIPAEQFRERVIAATAQENWVCDGNYGPVRDIVWGRATAVVWLNFSLGVVFGRILRRSLRRAWTRERLFAGNQESFGLTFFSRESVLLWSLRTFYPRRRAYHRLFADEKLQRLKRIEFRHPRQAANWLAKIVAGRPTE